MKKFWDRIFGLNYERSIWVEEEELGKKKNLYHKKKRYSVKIPQTINKKITLRLRGLGKIRRNKTGDLFLQVWLNKGEDSRKELWLSESAARCGTNKILLTDEKRIKMVIPPRCYHGLTIRLKGLGKGVSFDPRAPIIHQKRRGDLLVKLFVYPDNITPTYGSFDVLSTDNMVLEGWVYRKFDEVIHKIGGDSFSCKPIQAYEVADLFNESGWRAIFQALVIHLNLTQFDIEVKQSGTISLPGLCERTAVTQNNTFVKYKYVISINEQFLDSPFSIAAISAHELCHVVYSELTDETPPSAGYVIKTNKAELEVERTVDLLVFMFKIGEFQLRVARDKRLTLGYFNQEIFERMQVIVSKKLN